MHPVPLGESGGSKGQGRMAGRGITRPARNVVEEGWGHPAIRAEPSPLTGARGDPLGIEGKHRLPWLLAHGLTAAQRPARSIELFRGGCREPGRWWIAAWALAEADQQGRAQAPLWSWLFAQGGVTDRPRRTRLGGEALAPGRLAGTPASRCALKSIFPCKKDTGAIQGVHEESALGGRRPR